MRKDRRWTRRGAPCRSSQQEGGWGKGISPGFRFSRRCVWITYQIFDILPQPPNNQIMLNYTSKTVLNDINYVRYRISDNSFSRVFGQSNVLPGRWRVRFIWLAHPRLTTASGS